MKLRTLPFAVLAAALTGWIASAQSSCPSQNGPFSASGLSVQAEGHSTQQATLNLYTDGPDDELQDASGIVCSDCGENGPCESFVSRNGTLSGIHHVKIVDAEGNLQGYIAIGLWTGTYHVDCLEC